MWLVGLLVLAALTGCVGDPGASPRSNGTSDDATMDDDRAQEQQDDLLDQRSHEAQEGSQQDPGDAHATGGTGSSQPNDGTGSQTRSSTDDGGSTSTEDGGATDTSDTTDRTDDTSTDGDDDADGGDGDAGGDDGDGEDGGDGDDDLDEDDTGEDGLFNETVETVDNTTDILGIGVLPGP